MREIDRGQVTDKAPKVRFDHRRGRAHAGHVRIFLLGARGQIGRHLLPALSAFADVIPAHPGLDITAVASLAAVLRQVSPDVIVNAAAWTDVDGAERQPARAHAINAEAVAALGAWAAAHGAAVVHYSTDFVFDGRKAAAYTEQDEPNPLNAYGLAKLAGERALLACAAPAIVLRTSWVWSLASRCFVSTMLRLARERAELEIVADQIGSPTHCRDVAHATAQMLHSMLPSVTEAVTQARGVFHLAGEGSCSRHELACAAIELDPRKHEHKARSVVAVGAADFPTLAPRPSNTALDCTRFRRRFGFALPHWRTTLQAVLERGAD